ncbi:MAG: c-type cytochrome [Candidatus Thiodiazotropha sp. (ex Lucinoma kastoroae)]|nr:c-type cytochrome [Candidatus Thiodiazotropha sp. (ex Rostrolucina anterorostrata)]MCU7848449.1 c-type cytochrome [Candidatus Thiodiazotropha sp. (ex Lucinoma kastoroae)]
MGLKRVGVAIVATVVTVSCGGGGGGDDSNDSNTPNTTTISMIELGKKLFFDTNLSSGSNQSCGTCHDPSNGFTDPRVSVTAPVSEGSVGGGFGDRNAPTAAYASFSPQFGEVADQDQTPETDSNYQGGQFLDGRAVDLIEQAKGPFLNPVEMNNATEADVVAKVQNSSYSADFVAVFGAAAFNDIATAYHNIATAIAAFEASSEVNPFTSKFDAFLMGQYTMTRSEQRGFDLFQDAEITKCANCHTVGSISQESLFTNFRYYNIGTPKNLQNPAYIADNTFVDNGLGASNEIAVADQAAEQGKFKVPTLRNVELTSPYMHNGVYATLEETVLHYDIQVANLFITPEVNNSNIAAELNAGTFVGLGLSDQDRADLVNFMKTLTDGHF